MSSGGKDSLYLEIDEIVAEKFRPRRLFKVRFKEPSFELWLPADKIPSSGFFIKYCQRLIRNSATRHEIDDIVARIYDLLSICKKVEFDSLVSEFLTVNGLQLPSSKRNGILSRIKKAIKESCDVDELVNIRRDILIDKIIAKRKTQLVNLKKSEMQINLVTDSRKPIGVRNDVDLEEFPYHLRYINRYIMSSSSELPEEVMLSCDCVTGADCSSEKCSHWNMEREFRPKVAEISNQPYDKDGKLLYSVKIPIYECNSTCPCDQSCLRRVVQKGSNVRLEIFRTFNRCGWGVRTLESIPKGTFVTKYTGEILLWEEGLGKQCQEYLFDIDVDVDPKVGHSTYTVDAFKYGNISRFINHSCDSNLSVHVVYINNVHLGMAEIAFFAHRDIDLHEELSINYKDLVKKNNNGTCRCPVCF